MTNLVFNIISFLQARFDRSEKGEVSIEYVLVGGMAAVFIIAAMGALATAMGTSFGEVVSKVGGAF